MSKYQVIDIHCHIIPGVDDGARDRQESSAMAAAAARAGVIAVVATPHVNRRAKDADITPARIADMVASLTGLHPGLMVYPGAEINLGIDPVPDAALIPLAGGEYILGEADPALALFPERVADAFYELASLGYKPIVAHPERTFTGETLKRAVDALERAGCLFQVEVGSFTGRFGRQARRDAVGLLKEGKVSFIASDAHRPEDFSAWGAGLRELGRLCDEKDLRRLVEENPSLVLDV
jgi:protein-tyrosine phosphatase